MRRSTLAARRSPSSRRRRTCTRSRSCERFAFRSLLLRAHVACSPNQTYEVSINGKSETTGSLLEDFTPAVNPPKEIDDPTDSKPEDWVDDKRITDPEASKPEDWDEDAPFEIVDTEAEKPEGWLDDEPDMIPDPGQLQNIARTRRGSLTRPQTLRSPRSGTTRRTASGSRR
jgi:hypothetical protein